MRHCPDVLRFRARSQRATEPLLPWRGAHHFEHREHVEFLAEISPALAVRVVMAYANQNVSRLHDAFEVLVVEALREAWPCK
jgi:hypothetical protein